MPALVSLLCALAASVAVLWLPLYRGLSMSTRIGAAGHRVETSAQNRVTPREVDGPAIYGPLSLPVALAAIPRAARQHPLRRSAVRASAVLLLAFVLLTMCSIGFLYAPSAFAMGVAARRRH